MNETPQQITNPSQLSQEVGQLAQHWKARLAVGSMMLLMALVGLIIIDIGPQRSWFYWHIMIAGYALMALWLSWYLRHKQAHFGLGTFSIEILHWIGLILAVALVSLLVNAGILSRMQAGFVVLILLALTMFLAGLYVDQSFILIGIILGIFIAISAFLEAYLSVIMVPTILISIIILAWWVHKGRHVPTRCAFS